MKSLVEIAEYEQMFELLTDEGNFEQARHLYIKAAKAGSGRACMFLSTAHDPRGSVFPEKLQALFSKSRRRSNRYSNRQLKCLRRAAKAGNYPAMFNLYNAHFFGHPRLIRKSRYVLAEYWLLKAAESGNEIPGNELRLHIGHKNAG